MTTAISADGAPAPGTAAGWISSSEARRRLGGMTHQRLLKHAALGRVVWRAQPGEWMKFEAASVARLAEELAAAPAR